MMPGSRTSGPPIGYAPACTDWAVARAREPPGMAHWPVPGRRSCPGQRGGPPHWQDGGMERVIGIGGYFIRAADPQALSAWYRDCLGLDLDENGLWRPGAGPTVFATFDSETDYFGSRSQQTMLNLRVV